MGLNLYMLLIPQIKCLFLTFPLNSTLISNSLLDIFIWMSAGTSNRRTLGPHQDTFLSQHRLSQPMAPNCGITLRCPSHAPHPTHQKSPLALLLAISTVTTQIQEPLCACWTTANNWSPGFYVRPKQLEQSFENINLIRLFSQWLPILRWPCHKACQIWPIYTHFSILIFYNFFLCKLYSNPRDRATPRILNPSIWGFHICYSLYLENYLPS